MKRLSITQRNTNRETDSFKQYLKDVAEIELLTPEEELICTEKASRGDEKAIKELTEKNLRFVISVAKQYVNQNNSIEDLVNEGNIGLMMAIKKFNPSMGFKFISYAVWWIQKIIMEHLSEHGRIVRLPANKINNLSKLDKQINKLEQQLGRSADISEIIDAFGSEVISQDEKQLETLQRDICLLENISLFSVDSLDREISDDSGSHTTLADLIADESTKPTDYLVIDQNIKNEVISILNTLKPRDKRIMEALFGLTGNQPMTLKEIGDEVGITREMVRQIKEKTLKNLKQKLMNSTIRSCQ